jgi:hypothetical protein
MGKKALSILFTVLFLSGCNTVNQEKEKSILTDQESDNIGKWECTYPGYESIITFIKEDENYISIIDFTKDNSPSQKETLQIDGKKYIVVNSTAEEYYIITKSGHLELWDKEGLFTTAKKLMP